MPATDSTSTPSPIPLTPLQQGMYFTWLQDPTAGIDLEQMVCTLPEAIEASRLRAAWESLTSKHEILRTTFTAEAALIHSDLPIPWQELDLSPSAVDGIGSMFNVSDAAFPASAQAETVVIPESGAALPEFTAFLEQDRRTPLDLDNGPLQRLTLIRYAADSYQLIWTFHHILLDGRAITALLQEVFGLYDSSNSRSVIQSEKSFPSFQSHSRWQAALDLTLSTDFWQAHLSGISGPTPLIVNNLTSSADLAAFKTLPVQAVADHFLSAALTTTLRALAATHAVTLNTFVQAAFSLLLARYSGEERVIFGATRACRHTPITDSVNTIGLLINTLPMAVALPAEQPLLTLLKSLRQHWLDLRPHEHTPLTFIRRTVGLSASTAPFNHLLVFENDDYTHTLRRTGGPTFAHRSFDLHELTSVPLTLAVYGTSALHLHCAYSPATFDQATIQRFLGHMAHLLEQCATLPLSTPLSTFTLATAAERQLLLHDLQPTDPQLDSGTTLHAWFSRIVQQYPNRIAVTAEDASYTYAELDQRSSSIALALTQAGVSSGQIVGICMDRRAPLIASLLGILKAGAAYLPIDLAYPPERLAFMLQDAQAPILLTERPLAAKIPLNPAQTLFIEDIDFEVSSQSAALQSQALSDPDSRAYIIYTSGSTGLPKGCQLTHRNVVRLMRNTEAWYGFNEHDTHTLFHSTAFDFSVWEIWGALLYGGRLLVVPWLTTRSPDEFFALLCQEKVTVLNQTPSAFRQLIAAEPLAYATHPHLPAQSLRYLIFGGEALEMQSLQPWFDRHGDTTPCLVNMYGITETTVHVTYRPLSATDLTSGSVIGQPIPDLQLYILDPTNLQPVPIGIPGEMYIAGPGLAPGYLHRPELTAERFPENHLTGIGKLYKTGDLARFIPRRNKASQGSPVASEISPSYSQSTSESLKSLEVGDPVFLDIEYLGRIDHQVKIRGFRIELGEIENHLTTHPAIAEAAVLAREDRQGDKRLCAYLVADQAFKPQIPKLSPSRLLPDAADLRAHLLTRLPDYMVPAVFLYLEKFPITPNGKLDRKALPAPTFESPATTQLYQAPSTPAEHLLTTIWTHVLRLDRVSTTDNFFEVGGDSILSIQIIARAREAGLALTPRQLFENPTIASLASAARPLPNVHASLHNQLTPEDLITPFPLTPIQHWFFDQNLADSHHWNQSFLFTLQDTSGADTAAISPEALHHALQLLVQRHGALRLRFRLENQIWIPSIAPQEDHNLLTIYPSIEDLASHCAHLQTTLNYQTGPLLRAALFLPATDRSPLSSAPSVPRLCLAVHHLAIDGVSWRILLEDLAALLTGQALPAPTASWPQWARQLALWPNTPAARKSLPLWTALAGSTDVLSDSPRVLSGVKTSVITSAIAPILPAPLTYEKDTFTQTVSLTLAETAALLHQAPVAYRTRINDLLLTALALAHYTPSQPSLSLNLEGHGREETLAPGLPLDRTIGWFTTLFPVHLTLSSSNIAEAIPAIKEQLRAIPDNGASHQFLIPSLSSPRPPFLADHLVFNYLGQIDALTAGNPLLAFAPEPFSLHTWHSPHATRAHTIEINAMVLHGRLETTFTSASPAHSPGSLTLIAEAFNTALRQVIAHCLTITTPQPTPSDFPLAHLTQPQLNTLLSGAPAARLFDASPHVVPPALPQDICRLTPMQQLFYQAALTKPNAGYDQWHCRIRGPLHLPSLQVAWAQVIQRHTILRSTFHHLDLAHPVMLVHEVAVAPFTSLNAELEGLAAIPKFLASDASRVNDLTHLPTSRFTLLRLAPEDHFFCWSIPDLQLDGWSWPIVFAEAAQIYRSLTIPLAAVSAVNLSALGSHNANSCLPHPRPYRDYLTYLSQQTNAASDDFWHSTLTGIQSPTALPLEALAGPRPSRRTTEARASLPSEITALIVASARRLGLTPGVFAQAAWAALLSHTAGTLDIIHGSAFSGRPVDLPGADGIVGPFVNNLPVRSFPDPSLSVIHFLRSLHAHLTDLTEHQFTPLARIQDCSAVPWRFRLFDSLLVFQNYQIDQALTQLGLETTLTDFEGPIHTNFSLTLVVTPKLADSTQAVTPSCAPAWDLLLIHQEATCSASHAQRILTAFSSLLKSFASTPETLLSQHTAALLLAPNSSPTAAPIASQLSEPNFNHSPPRSPMERRLAAIWSRAFGLTHISMTDNFFDLGGHSLLMLRVHQAITQDLARPLPITALFQYPTLATLAAFLDPAADSANVLSSAPSTLQSRAAAARAAAQKAAAARR